MQTGRRIRIGSGGEAGVIKRIQMCYVHVPALHDECNHYGKCALVKIEIRKTILQCEGLKIQNFDETYAAKLLN